MFTVTIAMGALKKVTVNLHPAALIKMTLSWVFCSDFYEILKAVFFKTRLGDYFCTEPWHKVNTKNLA